MFSKKVPFFYLLLFTAGGILITYFADTFVGKSHASQGPQKQQETPVITGSCDYNIMRLSGYKYIRPFLHVEPECESNKYADLKVTLQDYISSAKAAGNLVSASVYLTDLSKEEWMCINAGEQFHPGSLFKVVTLITYLRMAEKRPDILNVRLSLDLAKMNKNYNQYYNSKMITDKASYTVKELLHYMIAYSDNRAAYLLHQYIDGPMFQKVFQDLGLPVPQDGTREYYISAQQYSELLKVLYDGSYLTITASEYATSLLSECDFKEGIVKGLPASVKVAHKFGEAGNDQVHELHESAIVYLDNNPYLLTVMTRGANLDKMAAAISDISRFAYSRMSARF